MIQLPINTKLTEVLEKNILLGTAKTIQGKLETPRISEKDLDTTKDLVWNKHMYVYHLPYVNIYDVTMAAQELMPHNKMTLTGRFHYPPGGFLGWHTNSNMPGYRIYV